MIIPIAINYYQNSRDKLTSDFLEVYDSYFIHNDENAELVL